MSKLTHEIFMDDDDDDNYSGICIQCGSGKCGYHGGCDGDD